MSIRYIDVLPSNISTTNQVGYSKGTPLVQFTIGSQDAYLLGSTIRLVGKYSYSGATGTIRGKTQWDPCLGIYNVIDQLLVASNKTNQTIEHIRHYNRFLASYIKVTSSQNDLLGHMNMSSLTTVENSQSTNFDSNTFDFSIALPCGLFLGRNPIPLSNTWGTKGLNITLHMAPDSNVFFSTDGATTPTGVTYTLTDLHLTAEVQVPQPDQLSTLMNQTANSFEYNSISAYYAVINNNYATINLNLGLRRVLSVFANFIPSEQINNYSFNGMATYDIRQKDRSEADTTEVIFTKGGVRFPLEYDIVSVQRDYPLMTSGDGQLLRNFVNAIKPFAALERTSISALNSHDIPFNSDNATGIPPCFGIGIAYDTISNQGIDFSSEPFSMIIKSELNTDNPTSAFVFAHSKESLLISPGGIQVLS